MAISLDKLSQDLRRFPAEPSQLPNVHMSHVHEKHPTPVPPGEPAPITQLLHRAEAGDSRAYEQLLPLVYDDLKAMAERHLRNERRGHTLQPTALVNEAYLRMVGDGSKSVGGEPPGATTDRLRFFAIASETMRRVLVDHARTRGRLKRGGGAAGGKRVELDDAVLESAKRGIDLVDLDAALRELEAADPDKARLVVFRFFGGMTIAEAAAAMGVSVATANREWVLAKGRLKLLLDGKDD
jgi:RNA polymerase sigma factor (TIGR02999 family)